MCAPSLPAHRGHVQTHLAPPLPSALCRYAYCATLIEQVAVWGNFKPSNPSSALCPCNPQLGGALRVFVMAGMPRRHQRPRLPCASPPRPSPTLLALLAHACALLCLCTVAGAPTGACVVGARGLCQGGGHFCSGGGLCLCLRWCSLPHTRLQARLLFSAPYPALLAHI